MLMHEHSAAGDAFVVATPTYKVLKQATLPAFLNVMRGLGTYSAADAVFTTSWGSQVYFRTGTDPDSVIGITNVRGVWGDEAGLFSLYFWENLQARAAFKEAPIVLTTSPYTLNWVFSEIIRPRQKDPAARPDVELVQARSDENPYFPKEEYERRKATMDPRRFRMVFGGQWEKMEGLVYDCFDDEENVVDPFPLPTGTKFYGGIDWGYNPDPFVLLIRAVTPDGKHFEVSEHYQTGLTPSQMVSLVQQKRQVWGVRQFFCDPSQPGLIAELNRHGCVATGADNDILVGIGRHYELVKTRRYRVFRGACPHLLDELSMYHYPEPQDLKPDQNPKEPKPVDQHNHAADAMRYVTMGTWNLAGERRPIVPSGEGGRPKPEEDQFKRIERLKRRSARGGLEEW